MPLISIVVPCHNEEGTLPRFAAELVEAGAQLKADDPDVSLELVLVDDGSSDGTLETIKGLAAGDGIGFPVRWVSFSRNFGKEAALYAGLERARGDFAATMDADLQDPPSLLPAMYDALRTGDYDNVATRRTTRRGEPPIRSFFARLFYRVINRISDAEIVDGARDYRLMKREMVDAVLAMGERNRFSKGIFSWVGFRTKWIEYENVGRAAGNSNWSFFSLMAYAVDGIVGFSTMPLAIASFTGILCSTLAVALLCVIIIRAALFGDPVAGWPSMMCAILLIGGLQMLFLGIIGQYLAKTYVEAKRRPLYFVREDGDVRSMAGHRSSRSPRTSQAAAASSAIGSSERESE